jgi:hypothetical protein
MALSCLSALPASSFEERVNSAAKTCMPDKACKVELEDLEMQVMLRVNRKFIQHMRARHPTIFERTLQCTGDGRDESEGEDGSGVQVQPNALLDAPRQQAAAAAET